MALLTCTTEPVAYCPLRLPETCSFDGGAGPWPAMPPGLRSILGPGEQRGQHLSCTAENVGCSEHALIGASPLDIHTQPLSGQHRPGHEMQSNNATRRPTDKARF